MEKEEKRNELCKVRQKKHVKTYPRKRTPTSIPVQEV
jgi:hypothetical protein